MKMIKAMKKLKFWSSKKNKKKNKDNLYKTYQCFQPPYYPTPPPPPPPPPRPRQEGPARHCQCHFCHPVEPSAPPLPPWLEPQLSKAQEDILGQNWADPFQGSAHLGGGQAVSTQQPSKEGSSSRSSSYQQYLSENPVYDLGVVPNKAQKTVSKGLFGCAVNFGSFLFRCFCPCFHISEPL